MLTNQAGNVPIRPTSLDFINHPNPVEPHTVPEKHPLNGTLEKTSKDEFLRLLLDKDFERPTKRRKSASDPKSLDLPKLPVRNGTKRLRIPPTLSGLHQPPPDAGLLPSMSVEQPLRLSDQSSPVQAATVEFQKPVEESRGSIAELVDSSATKATNSVVKRKHNKWTERETACLLKGVAKFGIGQWTKILNCPDYTFEDRTALDLKDRFRVCCPDEYKTTRKPKAKAASNSDESTSKPSREKTRSRAKKSDCVSASQLRELGIDKPFEKSSRRRRTGYSADEDEALLRGFKKHGNAWASIRSDEEILTERTATDLRDRFRTRYPDEYAKAGLAPRPEQFPKRVKQGEKNEADGQKHGANGTSQQATTSLTQTLATTEKQHEKENKLPPTAPAKKPPATSLLQMDDVFWGAPFEPVDADAEPITLDRGILDWAYDTSRPPVPIDNGSKGGDIDPLATLNLPRPTLASSINGATSSTAAIAHGPNTGGSANALPSLATITALSWPNGIEGDGEEPLELPSLMGAFGALDTDARAVGHFMSMDELLS